MERTQSTPEVNRDGLNKDPFKLDNVISFREATKSDYEARYKDRFNNPLEQDDIDADVEARLHEYLAAHGIDNDDERAKYAAHLRGFAYDQISDSAWKTGAWVDDLQTEVGPTGPELLRKKQVALFGEPLESLGVDTSGADTETDTVTVGPEIENGRIKLAQLRTELATITAKRQGKAFSVRNEKYNQAREAYNEQLRKLGKLELSEQISDDELSKEEKNKAVIMYLFDEQSKLRHETTELLKGTKVGKFVEWMNKGGKVKRMMKGAGIGLAAGLTGAMLIAPAGGALLAGGIVAGSRFARGFARRDARTGRGMQTYDEMASDRVDSRQDSIAYSMNLRNDHLVDTAVEHVDMHFNQDTKAEQKKRRKSVAWGIGGIALGAVAGEAVHFIGKMPSAVNLRENIPKWFAHEQHPKGPQTPPTGGGTPTHHPTPPEGGGQQHGGGGGQQHGGGGEGPRGPQQGLTRGEMFDGKFGTRELTPAGRELLNEHLNGYTVQPGDTVWGLSEQLLQEQGIKNPTIFEIDATKDVLLRELRASGFANSKGWLSVGDKIRIK